MLRKLELKALEAEGIVVKGFKFSGTSSGIKSGGRKDLALIYSDTPLSAAGVFTTSRIKAAPVLLDMERIKRGAARAVFINSGNANACTGDGGIEDAREMARVIAGELGVDEEEVLVSSTGVIGRRLPMGKLVAGIPALVSSLGEEGINDAAEAIMTTDSFPKVHSITRDIRGTDVTVAGIAKGAGMIAPDMATMLAYVVTDAAVNPDALCQTLKNAVDVSFNCITVDGDMSTNDTVIALASGGSGVEISEDTAEHIIFFDMLKEVSTALARMIVRDGEGATKLIEIKIAGAVSKEDAKRAALKIANSPLVKTAFYGEDANWGRMAAAIGGAGIEMDESKLDICFGDVQLVIGGLFAGEEAEKEAALAMKNEEVELTVDLNMGNEEATVWTCDLTHDYIRINAEYRS